MEAIEEPPLEDPNVEPTLVVTETPYLNQLKASHRARARAAMRWRPRFLKALATSCTWTSALKGARVSYNTVRSHQRNDPEFAAQLREAEEYGVQLLHDVCWKEAVEGHLEPVYFQGEVVGQIRKYDTRIQIEMLRAHLPDTFKTPGTGKGANLNVAQGGKGVVCDQATIAELVAMRQEALRAMAPAGADAPPL